MRIQTLATAAGGFLLGAIITFAIIRAIEKGSPELAFVLGAIVGTQLAAVVHRRHQGTTNSLAIKAVLGLTLAMTAVAFGIALHWIFAPFHYPEISIPIAAIGCFVFPFALFDTFWKATSKPKD